MGGVTATGCERSGVKESRGEGGRQRRLVYRQNSKTQEGEEGDIGLQTSNHSGEGRGPRKEQRRTALA